MVKTGFGHANGADGQAGTRLGSAVTVEDYLRTAAAYVQHHKRSRIAPARVRAHRQGRQPRFLITAQYFNWETDVTREMQEVLSVLCLSERGCTDRDDGDHRITPAQLYAFLEDVNSPQHITEWNAAVPRAGSQPGSGGGVSDVM